MASDEAVMDCLDVPISHRYQGDDPCSIVQFLANDSVKLVLFIALWLTVFSRCVEFIGNPL